MTDEVQASAAAIRQRIGDRQPRVAMVLGSGLGGLADQVSDAVVISYADLPGFPQPGVQGHAGRLVVGELGGTTVACMQGRSHAYEGHPPARLAIPVRTCRALGCEVVVLTNAAGSLRPEMGPGSLMIIEDHINWSGLNPLIGPNDDSLGPRFFDMSNAYDSALREQMKQAADRETIAIHEGVYFWYLGPSFETPAEIRAFQTLGASAVGMSTVPECLTAVHCGLRVAAVSVITNLAAGLQAHALSHQETMEQSAKAAEQFQRLLIRFLSDLTLD